MQHPSSRLRRDGPATSIHPSIDQTGPTPLVRQLFLHLRDAILDGVLKPAARLPSTRVAAREWGLSRGLVAEAYDLLAAEGFVEGRRGSGTYVAADLPARPLRSPDRAQERSARGGRPVSDVVEHLRRITMSPPDRSVPFATGRVVHDERTAGLLRRIALRHVAFRRDSYGDPQGEAGLREAIARHVSASRGVRCGPRQVFVTAGSQQSLDLACRVLVTPGRTILVEDPCYPPARAVFLLNGARLVGVPADANGVSTEGLSGLAHHRPAAAYVTPSHQYPTGAVLSLSRRLQLLRFADEGGCWIIEDDYDSEFRYEGHPIASLQGLDDAGRVIYVGTFSKALLPGLRVGYLVAPLDLVSSFRAVRPALDVSPAFLSQSIVADFLNEGYFPAHLRRLRERCRASRDRLVTLVRDRLGGDLAVATPSQGIHLLARSTGTWSDDVALAAAARARGVTVLPTSPMHLSGPRPAGLVLGFSGLSEAEADEGTRRLGELFIRRPSPSPRE